MTIRKLMRRGRPEWVLDYRVNGKRVRRWFRTKAEATAEAETLRVQRDTAGAVWVSLTPRERTEIAQTVAEIKAAGLDLPWVWSEFRSTRGTTPSKPLSAAIAEMIEAKKTANRRERYVKALKQVLGQFARGRETMPIAKITVAEIEQWIGGVGSDSGRATRANRISSFFAWAVRRGYCDRNPCAKIERIHVEARTPKILTVRQSAKVLVFTRRKQPRFLAWVALALFAGIRPEELDRLTWEDVDLEHATVRIDAAASKVRQRRIVHLMPAAAAWLRIAEKVGADMPLPHVTRRRYLRALRPVIGVEQWPQDILRHTAASYWLAEWQDAGRVAHELGNSAGILLRHYRELVSREEAKRFWGLVKSTQI